MTTSRLCAALSWLLVPWLAGMLWAAEPAGSTSAKLAAGPAGGTPVAASAGSEAGPDLVLLAAADMDACALPTQPGEPPDGAKASRAQMLASNRSVQAFNQATNGYLACVDQATTDFERQYGAILNALALRDVRQMAARMHNAAVDSDHKIADGFNQQLRIFKARSH